MPRRWRRRCCTTRSKTPWRPLEQIDSEFGPEIAQLVDGVTKLSLIEMPSESTKQAENFRKLLLATSNDLRVLLVKLADRLHNMRTLGHLEDAAKRRRIALETMEIYAPLAERIGMQEMKEELEDLAFLELNPEARRSVIARLDFLREHGADLTTRIAAELERMLAAKGLAAKVSGREKRPYSIWRKMERKNISFEQLSDVMAFRTVVSSVEDCYRALGIVHTAYPMIPNRFKDHISTSQAEQVPVNPHHRDRGRRNSASRCRSAPAKCMKLPNWAWRRIGTTNSKRAWSTAPSSVGSGSSWISWKRRPTPRNFSSTPRSRCSRTRCSALRPRAISSPWPRGATPVDLAYAIHTGVGDTWVGAKINGRIAPLRSELQNGDQVEIVRSKAQTPSPTWEGFVVTGKARSAIRRFIRQQERSQHMDLGRAILDRAFRQDGRDLTDTSLDGSLKVLGYKAVEDINAAVGEGTLSARRVIEAAFPGEKGSRRLGLRSLKGAFSRRASKGGDHAVPIRGLIPGMAVHLGTCCHPLPGDRIVGIVTSGKGVTIHTIDCESLESFANVPELWLDVSWDAKSETPDLHLGRLDVVLTNEPGSLNAMTSVIAKNLGNISNLKITNRSQDIFEFLVDVEVRDVKHLSNIVAALRADPLMHTVRRVRG